MSEMWRQETLQREKATRVDIARGEAQEQRQGQSAFHISHRQQPVRVSTVRKYQLDPDIIAGVFGAEPKPTATDTAWCIRDMHNCDEGVRATSVAVATRRSPVCVPKT